MLGAVIYYLTFEGAESSCEILTEISSLQGRDYSTNRGCGVDPRNIAQRIMEVCPQN